MTPLQISSVFWFMPCAAYAWWWCGQWVIATVLVVVTATSLVVHRKDRGSEADVSDWIDAFAVSAWMTCCGSLASKVDRKDIRKARCLASALACLFSAVAFNILRQKAGPWKSTSRRVFHVCMHACGVIGTLFLLDANKITSNTNAIE